MRAERYWAIKIKELLAQQSSSRRLHPRNYHAGGPLSEFSKEGECHIRKLDNRSLPTSHHVCIMDPWFVRPATPLVQGIESRQHLP